MGEFDLFMSLVGRDNASATPAPNNLAAEIAHLGDVVRDALAGSADVPAAMEHVAFLVDGIAALAAQA